MESDKQPFFTDRESTDSIHTCCYECSKRKAPHQRLGYWIGSVLVHALILLSASALLFQLERQVLFSTSDTDPAQGSHSQHLYCSSSLLSTSLLYTDTN